jgi:hypothetical protein
MTYFPLSGWIDCFIGTQHRQDSQAIGFCEHIGLVHETIDGAKSLGEHLETNLEWAPRRARIGLKWTSKVPSKGALSTLSLIGLR